MEVKIEKRQSNFNLMILAILFLGISIYFGIMLENIILIPIIIILCIFSLYYILKYVNEKILISEYGIEYSNFLKNTKEFSWSELSFKKIKKHYQIGNSKSMYYRRYEIREEYKLFFEGKQIINLTKEDLYGHPKELLDIAIKNKKIQEEKDIFEGEETFKLKTKLFPFCFNLFVVIYLIINLIPITIGLFIDFALEILLVYGMLLFIALYYLYLTIEEGIQLLQKVYYIKDKGFYKVFLGKKEYYDFKEIDRVKTKKYRCLESTIEYKIELYKEKKKILTLKNSKIGFYNFFDEIKNKI